MPSNLTFYLQQVAYDALRECAATAGCSLQTAVVGFIDRGPPDAPPVPYDNPHTRKRLFLLLPEDVRQRVIRESKRRTSLDHKMWPSITLTWWVSRWLELAGWLPPKWDYPSSLQALIDANQPPAHGRRARRK